MQLVNREASTIPDFSSDVTSDNTNNWTTETITRRAVHVMTVSHNYDMTSYHPTLNFHTTAEDYEQVLSMRIRKDMVDAFHKSPIGGYGLQHGITYAVDFAFGSGNGGNRHGNYTTDGTAINCSIYMFFTQQDIKNWNDYVIEKKLISEHLNPDEYFTIDH